MTTTMTDQERIAALEARVAALEALLVGQASQSEECRAKTCGYFTHYLAYGPPGLVHEGYHAAEKKCADMQNFYVNHLNTCRKCSNGDMRDCYQEKHLAKLAGEWEARVRA